MTRIRFLLAVCATTLIACGGKVAADSPEAADASTDANTTKRPAEEPPAEADAADPIAFDDAKTPPADDVAPPTVDAPDPVSTSCDEGLASGPPPACGAEAACSGTEITDAVRAKLTCYVDRCLKEMGRPPFCGKIALSLGTDGCTNDYIESDSAVGCVKYQGLYRHWPCAAGKRIEIERPCP